MLSINSPLVSIVMPACNGELYISDAIDSVLGQTYENFELIVADDQSNDRTIEIVRQFSDPRIRVIENKTNVGLTRNLNQAIRNSRGDYICWINQDDLFYPEKVQRQLDVMVADNGIGACFCQKADIDEYGRIQERFNPSRDLINEEDYLIQLFGGCFLSAPTVMMRRDVYHQLNGFDEAYMIAFDYDMWFRIQKTHRIKILTQTLFAFRHHSDNLSSGKNHHRVIEECADIVRKALTYYNIVEIYPFLNTIEDSQHKRVETAVCLISLAELVWSQKSWNEKLLSEILALIDQAKGLVPEMLDAYTLEEKVCRETSVPLPACGAAKHALDVDYCRLTEQLGAHFAEGNEGAVSRIMKKMYAMSPLNGDPYYQLALLFKGVNDKQSALRYCRYALRIREDNAKAQQLLEGLMKDSRCLASVNDQHLSYS